jgi:DNA-binding winged helix-turn-helix (wHTH) protein
MRYRFDDFLLDLETAELRRGDEAVPLRRQTFKLLQLLVESAPALVRRDDILDQVWGHAALSPNALPQAISELRRALGDQAEAPKYIETRRGTGYLFISEVQAEPVHAALASDSRLPTKRRFSFNIGIIALLVAAFAALAGATLWLRDRPEEPRAGQSQSTARSLALAPLPAGDYIPEWVPHAALELFTRHLQSEELQIYRGQTLGPRDSADPLRWQQQARELLGAGYSLTGHWDQPAADELQLNFSLMESLSGRVLISDSVRGQPDALEQMVDRASVLIRQALKLARPALSSKLPALDAADRRQYLAALAALAQGDAESALEPLRRLHRESADPSWIEVDLARALAGTNHGQEAINLLDTRLARVDVLPLGERLRLQAELARLRYQPNAAAAALRALVEIYPMDIDSWIALVEQELDALQGESARATLTRLTQLSPEHPDPRVSLLRARLALMDGDHALATALTTTVMEQAQRYDLPQLAVDAALAQARNLEAQGQAGAAQTLLTEADGRWAGQAGHTRSVELQLERLRLLRIQGELKTARSMLAGLESSADPLMRSRIAIETALLASYSGQHQQAAQILDEIEPIIAAIENPSVQIALLDARGYVALALNEVPLARQAYADAIHLAKQTGHERHSVALMVNAGRLLARQRRLAEADELWQQALTVFIKLGDRRGQATVLGNLAALASMQGQSERAMELNQQALFLFRELALSGPRARTAFNLALGASRDGRLGDADALYAEAAEVWLREEQLELAIGALVGRADVALLMADPVSAQRYLESISPEAPVSALARSHLSTARAQTALFKGQLSAAREGHLQALKLRRQADKPDWAALTELELARLDLLNGGNPLEVRARALILQSGFVEAKEVRDGARAALLVAESALVTGELDAAQKALTEVREALAQFHDQAVAMDLEWLNIWLTPAAQRPTHLNAFRQRAETAGYRRHALQAAVALGDQEMLSKLQPLQLPTLPYTER